MKLQCSKEILYFSGGSFSLTLSILHRIVRFLYSLEIPVLIAEMDRSCSFQESILLELVNDETLETLYLSFSVFMAERTACVIQIH